MALGRSSLPPLAGIGLKPQHYDAILDPDHAAGRPYWVEVHPAELFWRWWTTTPRVVRHLLKFYHSAFTL